MNAVGMDALLVVENMTLNLGEKDAFESKADIIALLQ